jgi:hypothetical protein
VGYSRRVAEPQKDTEQPMTEDTKIDPKHTGTRLILRTLGPVLAGLGLVLVIVGVGGFFFTPGPFTGQPATWPVFLGIPLLFVGVALCMMGFMGAFFHVKVTKKGVVSPNGIEQQPENAKP